jgi:hypothetical protein
LYELNLLAGGTAAMRWVSFFATGGKRVISKGPVERLTKIEELEEGSYFPSASRWSYANLFTHQNGDEARAMLKQLMKRKGTIVIGSEQVAKFNTEKKLGWSVYALPSDLYLHWHGAVRQKHIDAMIKMAKESRGRVFLCAFDVICGIFFHYMFEVNNMNWYLTLGAALDGLIGSSSRSWISNKCTKLGSKCTFFRSTYHWGSFTPSNGGVIPHSMGSVKKNTQCNRVRNQPDVMFAQ